MAEKQIKFNEHMWLSSGCPKNDKSDFMVKGKTRKRFICQGCGRNFTKEVRAIYIELKGIFENER